MRVCGKLARVRTVVPSEKADRTLVFGGVTLVREPIDRTNDVGWRWRVFGPDGSELVAAWLDRAGKIYSGSLYNVWIALPRRCHPPRPPPCNSSGTSCVCPSPGPTARTRSLSASDPPAGTLFGSVASTSVGLCSKKCADDDCGCRPLPDDEVVFPPVSPSSNLEHFRACSSHAPPHLPSRCLSCGDFVVRAHQDLVSRLNEECDIPAYKVDPACAKQLKQPSPSIP